MMKENNQSLLSRLDDELPESTVYWMLISIVAVNAWTIYLTYYNSRVLGLIITAIINKVIKYGHIQLGSFSFSVLSGKVMFRDVHLITEDFSLRIEYGWLIFRWWRPYIYKELNEDLSHLETRLSLFLDGFEFHVYNRSTIYTRLEKLFGLEREVEEPSPDLTVPKKASIFQDIHWRDLIPVIKTDIQSGHVIFGNYLMPYSFLLKFEKADTVYTTKPASTVFDLFMHVLKCDMENVRLMLVPSPKYNGPVQDEPPRYMGDGFVVFMSNDVDVYVYMDEPGIVQHEPEQIQMADGEVLVKRTYPCVGVDIKCGKNTDINYGPWVDRQRELIWKFFYPADYQPLIPTKEAEPGEKRQYRTSEIKLTINAVSTIDILFTKHAITQAIHMNAGKGSYVEITIPYVNDENGFTTKVKGQLMLVDATTSMSYRSLIECETLEFDVTAFYPRVWNGSQEWRCDFTACKVVTYLIFDLKHFFSDLVDDWSSKAVPDIYSFVPYTWTLNLLIKQFEILTLANENNWVDTSSQHQENAHVAFCGEIFELCVTFPFVDFLPLTLPISLIIKGDTVFCRLYLPENDTIRHALIAISENIKIVDREGNECKTPFKDKNNKQWRKVTKKSDSWVDCWTTPHVFFTVTYTFYPMPVLMSQTNQLTHSSVSSTIPEEDSLLMDSASRLSSLSYGGKRESRFDPGVMDPDLIQVELEVAPSTLVLYGSLLSNLIHLKENYLGEFQKAVDFVDNPCKMRETEATYVHIDKDEDEAKVNDKRHYRPFSVTVSVTLHDIHAHLAMNCSNDGIPCPSVLVERLCFEMDKSFHETKLQLLLSPCVLLAKDALPRAPDQEHLKDGHLALSGVQVRGHAMFSLEGLPIDAETLEYAWLIEATIGELTGKLTSPQLQNIAEFLQTFIMMIENAENKLQTSLPNKTCQHMRAQDDCPETKTLPFPCPNSEDIKYEMIRASVDYVNIFLVESGSGLNVQVHPLKIAHCNLHGSNTRAGITGMIEKIELKQYMSCASPKHNFNNWLEAGGLSLGPIMLEATMALAHPMMHQCQDKFLRIHDAKTKRLWFLWPERDLDGPPPPSIVGKCGCLGGCVFFGKNKNGPTFFKLRRHRETSHGAVPHISKDGDPGFGQSLLHANKLVFETSQLAIKLSPTKGFNGDKFAFTRGYMSELASPEGLDENDSKDRMSYVGHSSGGAPTPSEDVHSKSQCPNTLGLLSSACGDDVSKLSKKTLTRQSSIPSPSSSKSVLRSSTKKGRKPRGAAGPGPAKVKGKSRHKSSTSVRSETASGTYHTLPHISSHRQSSKVSKLSLDSDAYYTANESDSEGECITQSTTAWSTADVPSLTSFFGDEDTITSTLKKSREGKSGRFGSLDKRSERTLSVSDSSEESTLSFRSAPTDQDSEISDSDVDDDMVDMINLHSHMNQPITESPLLLSCYSQHLSHYCCQDWSSTAPQTAVYNTGVQGLNSVQSEYSLSSAGHSVYSAGVAWMPQFTKVKEGFSVNVMKSKTESKSPPANIAADLFNVKATMDREHKQQSSTSQEDENPRDNISKTTAVVKLSGSLDILITPLLLESLQRYVEGVTPTLKKINASSLIDSLHSQCLDRLKQQNKLKKGKEWDVEGKDESVDNLNSVRDITLVKTSSLQALFTLPKINICVLQASIVEEVIAFSNLGSISDLTAVSLLAVCIDGIKCQLLANKHSCKVAVQAKGEPLTRKTSSTPNSSSKYSVPGSSGGRSKGEVNLVEPDHESRPQEITREENVGTLQISHLHIQLRRLLKYSNYSEHVLLTAIPEPCSQVLFTLEQDLLSPFNSLQSQTNKSAASTTHSELNTGVHGNLHTSSNYPHPSPKRKMSRTMSQDHDDPAKVHDAHTDQSNNNGGIGFIMCECGLEDISITTVRRLGYRESHIDQLEQKLAGIDKTVLHVQEQARTKLEGANNREEQAEGGEEGGGKKGGGGAGGGDRAGKPKEKDHESADSSSDGPIPLSSPSCRMTSASIDSSTWDSDKTFSTDGPSEFPPPEPCDGDASHGKLDLKTIWFNFASPPPISINKKVDYTRLDWNLLSTATPAIDAWLNPSDRLMTSVRQLVKAYSKRLCCVMACMMIEGLESSGIHVAYKSKFNKLTPLSKTLQEDPSNQLLTVLRKYLHKYGTVTVERAVTVETLPQLITVQKGILALMRQWKNMLYMPNLSQINFKARRSIRPYNVSFALPKEEDMEEMGDDNDDIVIEQFDIVDERMSLLQAEGGITQRSCSVPSMGSKGRLSVSTQGKTDRTDGIDYISAESFLSGKPTRLSGIFKHKKSTSAIDSPLERSTSNLAPPPTSGLNRNDSNISFTSLIESVSSNDQAAIATPPHTPMRTVGPKQSILKNNMRYHKDEDLYQWMAKQQGEFNLELDEDDQRCLKQNPSELYVGGLGSTWSQEDSRTDLNENDYTMATSIMQLADAQILFKPVLQSLGLHVESVRPSAMMKKFGGHLLLQGHLKTFKILIAESEEHPNIRSAGPRKPKGFGKRSGRQYLTETAAFQCESFDVNVSLKDVVDFNENREDSRFPYKFAMHKLEAKPSTLQINLLVNVAAVRQHVDMALLRLAHQVFTMVGNVKDTRVELKRKRSDLSSWTQTHRKQASKDSTSSADTQHSDVSQRDHIFGSFHDILGSDKDKEDSEWLSKGDTLPSLLTTGSSKSTPSKWSEKLKAESSSPFIERKGTPSLLTGTHKSAKTPTHMSHFDQATGGSSAEKHDTKPRPQGLPLGQIKKSAHLRFAQDLKSAQSKEKEMSSPHASNALNQDTSDVITPPQSLNLSDSVVIDLADTSSPALNEKTIIDEIEESTPQCWKHLYQLLELYATMPEPKTVSRRHNQTVNKLPVIEEEEGGERDNSMKRESRVSDYGTRLSTLLQNRKSSVLHGLRRESSSANQDIEQRSPFKLRKDNGNKETATNKVDAKSKEEEFFGIDSSLAHQSLIRTRFKQSIFIGESVPLIVFGILKIDKVLVSAELSGLSLEANTTRVHATGTYKKKVKGFHHRVSSDSSFTAHMGYSAVNLREGEPPDWQTVVRVDVNKSQALLSSLMRRGKEHNSVLTSLGLIEIDIPQHPVALHGMMARSTKRITATLQELGWPAQSSSRSQFSGETNQNPSSGETSSKSFTPYDRLQNIASGLKAASPKDAKSSVHRHFHLKSVLQGIVVGASILPSLKAQYKTDVISATGVMGRKMHFTITLPKHLLSFRSKITAAAALADNPIPTAANIELPPIQIIADYRVRKAGSQAGDPLDMELSDGLELVEGNYLYAVAEVGMLEHSLTTDLLNHLVFVQKVFMKEINEIVQKVSGSGTQMNDYPSKMESDMASEKPLLYSVSVRFKGIQVTATTPTSNAVRFETGEITLDLSNRFHLPQKEINKNKDANAKDYEDPSGGQKMFIQAIIDLSLSLGQLLKNPVFEEAEPEFHTMAFFKTTIKIRNALKHEMIPNLSHDQEALLINLTRPIILAQPLAFDKAVLVWLNYKNAYEYWTEQRMALNKEVLTATRQVIDKLPQFSTATSPAMSTLFLQLTVDDMGICVPLISNPFQMMSGPGFQSPRVAEAEQGSALVLTVESTQISACSSGSLVSKGKFKGFCLRFADDFGSSWDDWKPWPTDSGAVMNQCKVPSGTYEVCSRTINKQDTSGNAKWILNVQWDMKGIDVHLDTDIGKRFTLLGHTLTMLAGQSDDPYMNMTSQVKMSDDDDDDDDKDVDDETSPSTPDTQGNSQEDLQTKRRTSLASDILSEDIFSDRFDPKERVRKIEQEMNEQAKIVQELKECGASEATIETEKKRLDDLQSLLFQDFRRDILEMLKRKGDRASLIKDNLGLSNRPTGHYRSKSTGGPKLMKHLSMDRSHMASGVGGDTSRRQSEDFARRTKVSFSGTQLSTYTPPHSPSLDPFLESGSDREDEDGYKMSPTRSKRSRSLEVITSSGSDSQTEYFEDVTPYLRKPHHARLLADESTPINSRDGSNKLAEQSIDFELDVKVFIDRGNCVLYPKEAKEEEFRRQAKRERQMAGDSSPPNKRKMKRDAPAPTNVGSQRKISSQPDTTVFFIPSVDVKVHYNSKTDSLSDSTMTDETFLQSNDTTLVGGPSTSPSPFVPEITISSPLREEYSGYKSENDSTDSSTTRRSSQLKRASLYAWFSLQTLPEEMIISPTLLDFMEQALEPLPITPGGTSSILRRDMMDSLVNNMDLDASQGSLGVQSMSFFPVDVLVHIKVDPSFIRFNCHPVSRVECLLQVPSLDLFFSTKKTDINESMLADTTQTPKSCKTPQSSAGRTRHSSGISEAFYPGSSSGGLSVTGCMSDFSLYIFHPYGTGVQRRLAPHTDQPGFRGQGLGSISENATNAIHDLGRRDSLSLNVEYIRVNISRTRKLDRFSEPGDSPVKGDQQTRSNTVRFSAICDIGSASFKYDMRRLSEILSLPKAWYRRTLARRLFLGDESINVNAGNEPDSPNSSRSSNQSQTPFSNTPNSMSHPALNLLGLPTPLKKHHRRGSSGDKIRIQLSPEFKSEIASRRARGPSSHVSGGDQPTREQSHRKKSRTLSSPDMQHRPSTTSLGTASLCSSWETLVLFAVKLSELNLEVNMANVMGNTEWCTKELKSQGRLSINSNGHKNLNIEAGFDKSSFESKGGIVGGVIGVQDLKGHFTVSEDPQLGQDPDHQANLSVSTVEMKIDYMGSSIIMTRFSNLQLLLKDEWHVESNASKDAPLATNRSAFLFVNGKLSWSHFHLMISRSTTPDLIKIISKLDEFFCQQVMSSRRVFQHTAFTNMTPHTKVPRKISESAVLNELRHHRHWQTALQHLLGCQFSMLPSVLPQEGMVLGGTMTLEGEGLMLASFHGVNFRAKYWALFNIKDPYIHFSTEAQRIPEGGTHIVQDLQFVVGQQGTQPAGVSQTADGFQNSMATISKISRTQHMPPNFTNLDEWFTYAMTASVTDPEVVTEFQGRNKEEDHAVSRKFSKVKAAHYSHDTEVIFAFPSMYMNLKTSHFQGDQAPSENAERPTVECSFIAEFYDHIYVAMDAEVILFLHDLVSSYIREKDKGVGSRVSASLKSNKEQSKMEEKSKLTDPTSALKHDFRSFECKTWQLEPTLRLIHWASTKIDPVGADYVLQKLGFSKARVTIPKWVQRGFMDPLDKVLSVLVDKLILALRDQHTSSCEENVDLDVSIGPTGTLGKD